jgi:hypothetical protein
MKFDLARKIADAVLYEGYILYPYRPSAVKNQFRWQFGVIAPRAWSEAGGGEPWEMQTECLIKANGSTRIEVVVRFLQVQPRNGEGTWEEGIERTIELDPLSLHRIVASEYELPIEIECGQQAIKGYIRVSSQPIDGFVRLRVRLENRTEIPANIDRALALRHSLVGTHTLLSVTEGKFISLMDPPPEARTAAAACLNVHTWPVLVGPQGESTIMLSSPIILQDYPAVAPESPGDFFDATEIDELLTLRVMTLTDEEKREACAADERARKIIERSESIPQEVFERLHGALRDLEPAGVEDFFNPAGEVPETASVAVGERRVSKGTRVRLAPNRRSDSMDQFLAGRTARVEAVHRDVEDRVYVAVSVEDNAAADLNELYRRFYYFYPDEIEVLEA